MDLARFVADLLRNRTLMRIPIGVFRAGCGFVFGGRILLLDHIGRVSGRVRSVMLETVDRPDRHTVVVASGFGTRSQWYRNLVADPRCRVSIGFIMRRPARAELLDDASGRAVLEAYARRYPRTWRALHGGMAELAGVADPAIPIVRLHLQPRR